MTSLRYIDKYSKQNNNIVVFISKLSDLTNISLPDFIQIDLKNKTFHEILSKKGHLEFKHIPKNKQRYKIFFKLVSIPKNNFIIIGSEIYDYFNYKFDKNITFMTTPVDLQKVLFYVFDHPISVVQ